MSVSPMDPEEFRKFSFNFDNTQTEDHQDCVECSRRASRHVQWANLPKPDHVTGEIVHVSPTRLEWKDFNHSAYTTNARRRSSSLAPLERYGKESRDRRGKRRKSSGPAPEFQEVKWQDDVHPGTRIPVNVYEGESVSPRSSAAIVPLWGVDMDAHLFRVKVQPSRVTGRRRPGMTAKKPVQLKAARVMTPEEMHDEHEESCVIQ